MITAELTALQNVSWANAAGVAVNGNSLTKTAATAWGNAGASSTQSIASGDGYVEVTATETTTARLFGFSHTDVDQSWPSIDFAIDLDLSGSAYVFESGNNRGNFGPYATGDKFQVAIVGGVVKYKKNGTVFYTSSVSPTYPLIVDTALHANGSTLSNVVLSSSTIVAAKVQWLVADHLGTPRLILDQTGTLANLKRHDYLPFGEEISAGTGGRTTAMGYVSGDGVRQQFTLKERDVETGLDYFGARYFASTQGRFTSPDPFSIILLRQNSRNDEKTRAAFSQFIGDPRRWNRFAYAVNSPLVFTDKTGLDIMIIENHATDGNPFGHTAIAITGRGVYSMGNAERGDAQDNKNNIIGGGVKDYVIRELSRRNTTLIIIKTTPEQDAAAAKSMEQQAASKPQLTRKWILSDNCSVRVNRALDAAGGINMSFAAGIQAPPPTMPGSAGYRALTSGLPATVIDVPQDSNLTESDRQAIQQFEPVRNPSPVAAPGTPGGTPVVSMPAKTERKRPENE